MYQFVVVVACVLCLLLMKKYLLNRAFNRKQNQFNDPEEDAQAIIDMYRKKRPDFLLNLRDVSVIIQLVSHNITSAARTSNFFLNH